MNSNLLEFGGSADLIATAICDFENNGIQYKKGEVLLNLKDALINFQYNTLNASKTVRRNQVYYHEFYLDSCTINVTPFNQQIQNLLSSELNKELVLTTVEESMAMNNMIFLLKEALEDSFIKVEGVTDFRLEKINDVSVLVSEEFENQTYYTIQYQYKEFSNNIKLDNQELNIPYVKLQIHVHGNVDKESEDSYFIIEKAAISLTPVVSLIGKNISHVFLMFKVIDCEEKPKLALINNEF